MKLGIVVNVMDSGEAGATTYRLAADAINLGHEVWVMSTGNLAYNPNDTIGAFARTVPQGQSTSARFVDVFKSSKAVDKWHGNQRIPSRRIRQRAEVREGQLHPRGTQDPRTKGPIHEVLRPQLQQRRFGDAFVCDCTLGDHAASAIKS